MVFFFFHIITFNSDPVYYLNIDSSVIINVESVMWNRLHSESVSQSASAVVTERQRELLLNACKFSRESVEHVRSHDTQPHQTLEHNANLIDCFAFLLIQLHLLLHQMQHTFFVGFCLAEKKRYSFPFFILARSPLAVFFSIRFLTRAWCLTTQFTANQF